jgi:hypothetical protein
VSTGDRLFLHRGDRLIGARTIAAGIQQRPLQCRLRHPGDRIARQPGADRLAREAVLPVSVSAG